MLWVWVYEGYGVAVSGAGAWRRGVCGAGGGGGGEVFGWVEGGGEEGGVDAACCAGGGVCLEGEYFFFPCSFPASPLMEKGLVFSSRRGRRDLHCFCILRLLHFLGI